MSLFPVDYTALSELDNKTYKLFDVKDKLIRVAADLVRFKDAQPDELWEIKSDADGEYIVARYNLEEEGAPKTAEASTKSPWEAVVKEGSQVQLFYKGVSFTKFAHKDAETIKNFLPKKLSTDKSLVSALLVSLSPERQEEVQKLYPELF
jgi:hypothetical protein